LGAAAALVEDFAAGSAAVFAGSAAAQEHQIEVMLAALKSAGIGCQKLEELEKFDPARLNKLVE